MNTLLDLKCPSCGAQLSVEEDREFVFCQYCGSKILVQDDSKFTYRHIDDADIKRAETERILKLKQIELEEKKQGWRKTIIIGLASLVSIMILVGIILICVLDEESKVAGYLLIAFGFNFGMLGSMFILTKKKDKRKSIVDNGIRLPKAIASFEGKNYEALVSILQSSGFSNITCVPMKDLNLLTAGKKGQVESTSIDGEENIHEGDIFSPNANIVITYHSRK